MIKLAHLPLKMTFMIFNIHNATETENRLEQVTEPIEMKRESIF